MGQNVTRVQDLQEELAQRRASLLQDSVGAQALKGQEALLAEIVEEEMAHQTQVSVLLHLHPQQGEEIKAQSKEIKLCCRDSKLSWNRCRNNNRVVSLKCQWFSQLHPG